MTYLVFVACLISGEIEGILPKCVQIEMVAPDENISIQKCEKSAQFNMMMWLSTHPNYGIVKYWCERET